MVKAMRLQHSEGARAEFLLSLLLAAVTGFNLVLLYKNALAGQLGWVILIFVAGVLIPGTIPVKNLVWAIKKGDLPSRWRDLAAAGIGAMDCLAILAHWPEALEDISWVSVFIIGSLLAFFVLTQTAE